VVLETGLERVKRLDLLCCALKSIRTCMCVYVSAGRPTNLELAKRHFRVEKRVVVWLLQAVFELCKLLHLMIFGSVVREQWLIILKIRLSTALILTRVGGSILLSQFRR